MGSKKMNIKNELIKLLISMGMLILFALYLLSILLFSIFVGIAFAKYMGLENVSKYLCIVSTAFFIAEYISMIHFHLSFYRRIKSIYMLILGFRILYTSTFGFFVGLAITRYVGLEDISKYLCIISTVFFIAGYNLLGTFHDVAYQQVKDLCDEDDLLEEENKGGERKKKRRR